MLIKQNIYEYLLGVFLGDGSIGSHGYQLSISVGRDIIEYANILKELFIPYDIHIYKKKGYSIFTKNLNPEDRYSYSVVLNNKKIIDKYFSPFKKNYLWKPPKIKNPEYFLGGIFDTDGTIRHKASANDKYRDHFEIVLYQKNRANLELLIPIFDKLNLFPTLTKHMNKNDAQHEMWMLRFSHFSQIKIFQRTIMSYHPLKKKRLLESKYLLPYGNYFKSQSIRANSPCLELTNHED